MHFHKSLSLSPHLWQYSLNLQHLQKNVFPAPNVDLSGICPMHWRRLWWRQPPCKSWQACSGIWALPFLQQDQGWSFGHDVASKQVAKMFENVRVDLSCCCPIQHHFWRYLLCCFAATCQRFPAALFLFRSSFIRSRKESFKGRIGALCLVFPTSASMATFLEKNGRNATQN